MSKTHQQPRPSAASWLWRVSSVLFVIWGLVHLLAGISTIVQLARGNAADAVYAITPKADRALVEIDYPDAVVAILSQHGFNLLWIGVVTVAASVVWRRHQVLYGLAAFVAGCLDLGYFVFIDVGGFAEFPGPQMTYICAAAIILGLIAMRVGRTRASTGVVGHAAASDLAD